MIVKSMSRRSGAGQLIKYLFNDTSRLVAEDKNPVLIKKNVRSNSMEEWIKEFKENESLRINNRSDNVKLFHTVLSFSNKDKGVITEQMLNDIAKQYMKLRGGDSMYIGAVHYEKDHTHIHLVQSGTKYRTGESNRISREEFKHLKLALQSYQQEKYPELINSLPEHGKGEIYMANPSLDLRGGRTSKKQELINRIKSASVNATSLESVLEELKQAGHEPYYRGGKLTGIKFAGEQKFRFSKLGIDTEALIPKLVAPTVEEAIQTPPEPTTEIQELEALQQLRKRKNPERIIDQETTTTPPSQVQPTKAESDRER